MWETLRVGLEASVAAQLLLFMAFVLTRADWRRPTGFFLAMISGGAAFACLVNALVSLGVFPPWLRTLNYFIELALWSSLLGLVSRAAAPSSPLRRQDSLFFLAILVGAAALASPFRYVPDATILVYALGCLAAAFILLKRRASALREAKLYGLVGSVVFIMAAAVVMRIGVSVEGGLGRDYRDSYAYLGMLLVCFGLAAHMLWFAMTQPQALVRSPRSRPLTLSPEIAALEAPFNRLMEVERIYLRADLTLSQIATRLNGSARQVSTLVATRFGQNISNYLNRKRAEFAAATLVSRTDPITTIMYDSGFGSKSAFQREFARRFGMSPTEYRRRHSGRNANGK